MIKIIYKAVVHMVLLYGSDIWVVTEETLKVLEGFHNWVPRNIAGKTALSTVDGDWEWPPVMDTPIPSLVIKYVKTFLTLSTK